MKSFIYKKYMYSLFYILKIGIFVSINYSTFKKICDRINSKVEVQYETKDVFF